VSFTSELLLLSFCLCDLSIDENRVLDHLHLLCWSLYVLLCQVVLFPETECARVQLHLLCSLDGCSFYQYEVTFFVSSNFGLKSALLDMNVVTPAYCKTPYAWKKSFSVLSD
jgi:hypothetical protein